MIAIRVGNKRYKGVYSWKDMTLGQFCRLAAIPMPEGYEAFILADGKFNTENIDAYVTAVASIPQEQIEQFPDYYRKVIGVLSNIPDKVTLTTGQINDIYDYFFKPFVLSLLYYRPVIHFMGQITPYEPEKISKFRIGRHVFRLPRIVRVMDEDVPLFEEPIITYSEASDVIGGARITRSEVKRLALFMAIYCRKWYEKSYKEERSLRRQDLFMKAPMSVVWSVFFYTVRRLPDSRLIIRLFGRLPKPAQETVEAARIFKDLVTGGSFTR